MLNVVCLKVGSKYTAEYVNRLYSMVGRNLDVVHRFVCLTDRPYDANLLPDIETVRVGMPVTGWWHKVSLFQPEPYGMTGRILFLDLDVVIVGDLGPLATFQADFAIIRDFMNPAVFNSSVFLLAVGARPEVWNQFDPERDTAAYHGDQDWITRKGKPADLWPAEWCVSYRLAAQVSPPAGAKVVCFHGRPKPHEVGSGSWVKENWG